MALSRSKKGESTDRELRHRSRPISTGLAGPIAHRRTECCSMLRLPSHPKLTHLGPTLGVLETHPDFFVDVFLVQTFLGPKIRWKLVEGSTPIVGVADTLDGVIQQVDDLARSSLDNMLRTPP